MEETQAAAQQAEVKPDSLEKAIAAKWPCREIIPAFFKGESITAGSIVSMYKALLNEYHAVLPLPFIQDLEAIGGAIERKISGKAE